MYSNFPKGFADGLTVRGVPITQAYPGKVFWVSNAAAAQLTGQKTGSDGNKGTFDAPFATLDYAIGRCVAGRGDVIFIKPGHAESVATATALALDVAGVAVIGLGAGSARPTFTLTTATTATIGISAANIAVQNVVVNANFADIVSAFTVSAADVAIEKCRVKDNGANVNFGRFVTGVAVAEGAAGLTCWDNTWITPDTGLAAPSFAVTLEDHSRWDLRRNYASIKINPGAGFLKITDGKSLFDAYIADNVLISVTGDINVGHFIVTDQSDNSGVVARNFAQHTDTAAEVFCTASSGFSFFENRSTGVAGATGYVLPAVDS